MVNETFDGVLYADKGATSGPYCCSVARKSAARADESPPSIAALSIPGPARSATLSGTIQARHVRDLNVSAQ